MTASPTTWILHDRDDSAAWRVPLCGGHRIGTFMDSPPNPIIPPQTSSNPSLAASADHRLSTLSTLLGSLEEPTTKEPIAAPSPVEIEYQNKLAQVRLGLASSLFTALRAKHAPTASHSLRVALGCSSWCHRLDVEGSQRDEIEVAALLHDIGTIGIPDHVLSKPGKLTGQEAATIDRHRTIGEQILLNCCASQEILNIVKYASAWYDGSRSGFDRHG